MNNNYTAVELVSPNDMGYLRRCRYNKNKFDGYKQRKNYIKNTLESTYQKELSKWENIVQVILASFVDEEKKRILKYSFVGGNSYREIDFIGKKTEKKLIFCEIKLKQNFKKNLSPSALGWRQLNKSLTVAKDKYEDLGGLAVCVDMSYLYGTQENNHADYNNISDLKEYLEHSFSDKNVIWLDSKEVSKYALSLGLINAEQIKILKDSFLESSSPMSLLQEIPHEFVNNPFDILSKINLQKDYLH